jgi:hypothetical protein
MESKSARLLGRLIIQLQLVLRYGGCIFLFVLIPNAIDRATLPVASKAESLL